MSATMEFRLRRARCVATSPVATTARAGLMANRRVSTARIDVGADGMKEHEPICVDVTHHEADFVHVRHHQDAARCRGASPGCRCHRCEGPDDALPLRLRSRGRGPRSRVRRRWSAPGAARLPWRLRLRRQTNGQPRRGQPATNRATSFSFRPHQSAPDARTHVEPARGTDASVRAGDIVDARNGRFHRYVHNDQNSRARRRTNANFIPRSRGKPDREAVGRARSGPDDPDNAIVQPVARAFPRERHRRGFDDGGE